MGDGGDEGRERLAREGATRAVAHRDAHHDRESLPATFKHFVGGKEGGFGIERVEDGLDEDEVDPTLHQSINLLAIDRGQIHEGHRTSCRIVDIGADGGRAVGRPHPTRHKARACAVLSHELIGHPPRNLRPFQIELPHKLLALVVGHRNALAREGVGGQDVSSCRQVTAGNIVHHVGTSEVEQVVVPLQLAGQVGEGFVAEILFFQPVGLNHSAHCPIQNENALR